MDKRFPIQDQIEMLAASLKGHVITPQHFAPDNLFRLNQNILPA